VSRARCLQSCAATSNSCAVLAANGSVKIDLGFEPGRIRLLLPNLEMIVQVLPYRRKSFDARQIIEQKISASFARVVHCADSL
jgi:hypothetical protein